MLKTPSPKNKLKPLRQATGISDEKDGEITVIKEESMSGENIMEPSKGIVTFELKSRSPMSIGSKNNMGQQTIDQLLELNKDNLIEIISIDETFDTKKEQKVEVEAPKETKVNVVN